MAALYAAEDVAQLAAELRDPLYRFRIGVGSGREVAEAALRALTDNGWLPPAPMPDYLADPEPVRHLAAVPDRPSTPDGAAPLTRPQRRVLGALAGFIDRHGYAPTVRELAEQLDLSTSTVHYQLSRLAVAGWIRRATGWRALAVLHRPKELA